MHNPRSTEPSSAPPDSNGSLGTFGAATVVALAWLIGFVPALCAPLLGLPAAAAIAAAISIVAGFLVPERALAGVALALIPTSLAVSSQLVPLDGRYLPMAAVAGTLLIGVFRLARRGQVHAKVPPTSVFLALVAYLAWAVVAALTSIDRATSLIYLGGAAGVFLIAFVLVPTAVAEEVWTRRMLATVAATAGGLVVSDILLSTSGPITLFGEHVGLYQIAEILVAGTPTTLVVPRAMGPFPVPADAALALALGLVALLALRRDAGSRARKLGDLTILFVAAGLLLTMARSGWLVAAIATGLYAALVLIRGRLDRAAVLVAAVFGAACILLSFNVLGARLRHDIEVSRYGPELTAPIPGADSEQFRGGMDLSGRPLIWDASLDAIRARPVVGWGPGTNAQAIAPYLTGEAARFRGLTSHNTWLRAAVELGLPGLAAFVAFGLASAAVVFRRRRVLAGERDRAGPAFIAIAGGIVAWQAVESLTLGGLSYPGFIWILSIGALVTVSATTVRPWRPRDASDAVS